MSASAKKPQQPYVMSFDPMTIEHLGLRLYSTLPPVLNELVSNAFDSDSPRVEITVPTASIRKNSSVVVRDYGHALTDDELREEYLPIGRCRRGSDGTDRKSRSGDRTVTGRKGLGKLSVFGVADTMTLRSIQGGTAICLEFSFSGMQAWAERHGQRPYEAKFVSARSGKTSDPNGVELTLTNLRRKSPVVPDTLRRGLARRLTCIGPEFEVLVNGVAIGPGDRITRDECADGESWDVADLLDIGGTVGDGLVVRGWIGFLEGSSQTNRGVDIYAHEKAVQLASFFNLASTHAQFARAHLVGEVHADFLDEDEDLISTARNCVVWESGTGLALQDWGQRAIKHALDQWVKERRKKKEKAITKVARFDQWVETRTRSEQRAAGKLVKLLIDDPDIEASSVEALLEVVKSSVETVGFHELLSAIEEDGIGIRTLLRLFDEWRVVEAREHLKLADGRRAAMTKLKGFIDQGALEVQEMQPLFEQHPWMLDSAWDESSGQTTYTQLLRKHCKEPKGLAGKDRRLDILGISVGDDLTVVELKRPQNTATRADLEQIERYVDWARDNIIGSGRNAPKYAKGLLVIGKQNPNVKEKRRRLAGDDIRVETYGDLYERLRKDTDRMDRKLKLVAPEYAKYRASKKAGSNKKTAKKKKRTSKTAGKKTAKRRKTGAKSKVVKKKAKKKGSRSK